MRKITNEKSITKAFVNKYGRRPNMKQLAKITGVSVTQLSYIDRTPNANVRSHTLNAIFKATRELYGHGLAPWDYLNNCDWTKGAYGKNFIDLTKEAINKVEEHNIARKIIIDKAAEEAKDGKTDVEDLINLI